MKTKLLALFFFILFLFIFVRESYPSRIWNKFVADNKEGEYTEYDNRVDLFNLIDSCKLVLVGNSIIDRAPWEALLREGTCNMGIGGDVTSKMLNRFAIALKTKPEKLIFCGGINDVIAKVDPEETINNIQSMLTEAINANIEVFFQPILPVSTKYPDHNRINATANYINSSISKFCKSLNCDIIDITHLFAKNEDGVFIMPADFTSDGLHPNSQLYKKWKEKIMDSIN